jgi:hypothetical protein
MIVVKYYHTLTTRVYYTCNICLNEKSVPTGKILTIISHNFNFYKC